MKGAVNFSLRLGILALVVSLTVVAFGTSTPGFLIVLSAMADNAPGLGMGNVIGSNIENIFLVFGLSAIIVSSHTFDFNIKNIFLL